MGRTFEAIERAKREQDSPKLRTILPLKKKAGSPQTEPPATLTLPGKKEMLLPKSFEQYQRLKAILLNRYPDFRHKVIMVASSFENEGCTTTALNLAKALAGDEKTKVLLVDGNLRSPSLHQVFGLSKKNGLVDILRGENKAEEVIKKTNIDNMFVVTCGELNSNLSNMYDNCRVMRPVFEQFKKHFGFVVVDTSPVILYPDSISLSSKVDGVIFVVEAEKTRWEVVEEAKEHLEKAGARILGGVLNKRKYYLPKAIYGGYK